MGANQVNQRRWRLPNAFQSIPGVDESVSRGCGLKRRKAKTMELNIKEAFSQHAARQRWHLWIRVISTAFPLESPCACVCLPSRASWIRCCLFFHKSQAIKQNYLCHPTISRPLPPANPQIHLQFLSPQLVRRLCAKKSGREATPAAAACAIKCFLLFDTFLSRSACWVFQPNWEDEKMQNGKTSRQEFTNIEN